MRIEDIVASIDLCTTLKELGVDQDSEFYYINGRIRHCFDTTVLSGAISAFTSDELGIMLPEMVSSIRDKRLPGFWSGTWDQKDNRFKGNNFASTKESDCRAKMLIHLIENHEYKVPII